MTTAARSSRARYLLEKFRKLRQQADVVHAHLDDCASQAAKALRDEGLRLPEIAAAMSRPGSLISPSCASRMLHGARSPLPWAAKGKAAE